MRACLLDFDWPPPAGLISVEIWRSLDGVRGRAYAGTVVAGWTPLEPLQSLRGASADAEPLWHYTVETDVAPENESELDDWYGREHLPGLADVPGTVRAQRYRRLAGTPRYVACYDLTDPSTLLSPAWLAVRATAWSSRVRPMFVNPQRTMFVRADRWQPPAGAIR